MSSPNTTQWPNTTGPFFCEQCCSRYDRSGDCSKCPGEPLLDLRDPDVVHLIRSFDDGRWQRRVGLFTALAIVVGVVLVLGGNVMLIMATGVAVGVVPMFIVGAVIVSGLSGILMAVFPPAKRLPADLPTG